MVYEPIEDESEATEVKGYDAYGNEVTLSAGTVPTGRVLVCATQVGYGNGGGYNPTPTDYWVVRVRHFALWNDHEPWYKGDPEIYVLIKGTGQKTWFDSPYTTRDVNKEGVEYPQYKGWNWGAGIVASKNTSPKVHSRIEVWEADWPFDGDDFVAGMNYSNSYGWGSYYPMGHATLYIAQGWETW